MKQALPVEIVRAALAQMKPRPSIDVYPGDWLRDAIAGCSLIAQAFWFRAMLVMHDAKPYGHMVAANGQPLTEREIVKRCGCASIGELRKAVAEIERAGIPGKTGDAAYLETLAGAEIEIAGVNWTLDLSPLAIEEQGVLYSRRMLRDRRLSLLRFFVSPKGQRLITQNLEFVRMRADVQKEAEAEKEKQLGSEEFKNPNFDAAKRLTVLLAAVEWRPGGEPPEQVVVGWEQTYGEELVAETVADVGARLTGKSYPYLETILAGRRADPSERPGSRNGRATARKAGAAKGGSGVQLGRFQTHKPSADSAVRPVRDGAESGAERD